MNLAREYGGRNLDARLDEIRISTVARSSNWLWATYQSIASNAAFATLSPVSYTPAAAGYDLFSLQIANEALRAPLADADGDGFANLLEYATGGNPTNVDALARLAATQSNGVVRLAFTRNTNSADAVLVVQGANALTNDAAWIGLATNIAGSWGGATNVAESGTGTPVTVYVSDAGGTNRFLRLRVMLP